MKKWIVRIYQFSAVSGIFMSFSLIESFGQTANTGYGYGGSNSSSASIFTNNLTGIWSGDKDMVLVLLHDEANNVYAFEMGLVSINGSPPIYLTVLLSGRISGGRIGENIGFLATSPESSLGLSMRFSAHRPTKNELMLQLESCDEIPSLVDNIVVTCDRVAEISDTFDKQSRYIKAL